jgi:hypothetical protein
MFKYVVAIAALTALTLPAKADDSAPSTIPVQSDGCFAKCERQLNECLQKVDQFLSAGLAEGGKNAQIIKENYIPLVLACTGHRDHCNKACGRF